MRKENKIKEKKRGRRQERKKKMNKVINIKREKIETKLKKAIEERRRADKDKEQ